MFHVITWITIHLPTLEKRKAELAGWSTHSGHLTHGHTSGKVLQPMTDALTTEPRRQPSSYPCAKNIRWWNGKFHLAQHDTTRHIGRVVSWQVELELKRFWFRVWFVVSHASMCNITSANQQHLCLHCVYVLVVHYRQSLRRRQKLTMCDAVWMSPLTHISFSVRPHFFKHVPQWPCPVRKRSMNDHWRRGSWKPGGRTVGSSTSEELITVYSRLPVFTPQTWHWSRDYHDYNNHYE